MSFFSIVSSSVSEYAEIGLLRLRLSFSQNTSLGDFLLASMHPIEKESLWDSLH